ncbi:hypothetical protein [[Kitasatospora] papulosa]|uniref:hypothetical protein n=1 Tax=[Kitasatospora] papulosa TaxID=1464011 RepID=UPI00363E77C9
MAHPLPAFICLAVSVFAAGSIPVLLLANADRLTPRSVRALPLTVAALLMYLGGTR